MGEIDDRLKNHLYKMVCGLSDDLDIFTAGDQRK